MAKRRPGAGARHGTSTVTNYENTLFNGTDKPGMIRRRRLEVCVALTHVNTSEEDVHDCVQGSCHRTGVWVGAREVKQNINR